MGKIMVSVCHRQGSVCEGPCHYFFQFVLQQITGFLRVATAGAQLGIFEFEQILHLGLQGCWKYDLSERGKRIQGLSGVRVLMFLPRREKR